MLPSRPYIIDGQIATLPRAVARYRFVSRVFVILILYTFIQGARNKTAGLSESHAFESKRDTKEIRCRRKNDPRLLYTIIFGFPLYRGPHRADDA